MATASASSVSYNEVTENLLSKLDPAKEGNLDKKADLICRKIFAKATEDGALYPFETVQGIGFSREQKTRIVVAALLVNHRPNNPYLGWGLDKATLSQALQERVTKLSEMVENQTLATYADVAAVWAALHSLNTEDISVSGGTPIDLGTVVAQAVVLRERLDKSTLKNREFTIETNEALGAHVEGRLTILNALAAKHMLASQITRSSTV